VSGARKRRASRWLRVCVLLCAVAALSLGVAYADAPDQDCETLGLSLREQVANGELRDEEVREQYINTGCRRAGDRCGRDCEAIGRRLHAAVDAGELTPEEALDRCNATPGEPRDGREQSTGDR